MGVCYRKEAPVIFMGGRIDTSMHSIRVTNLMGRGGFVRTLCWKKKGGGGLA